MYNSAADFRGIQSMTIRARLLHNPVAGTMPSRRFVQRAERVLRRLGWEIEVSSTSSQEEVAQIAWQSAKERFDVFVVAGGDGTIGQAASGLAGSNTALAVLPSGTANVWAQELRLPRLGWLNWFALESAANQLAHGQYMRMDLGSCNEHAFLLWAGVGLDAEVVRRLEPLRKGERQFAFASYFATAVWRALDWRGVDMRVTTNRETVQGHFLLAVASNIHAYGGGLFRLAPEARVDDGQMDLWLFEGHSFPETLQRAWDLYTGRHVTDSHVRRLRFQTLRLEADGLAGVQIDGEPRRGTFPIEMSVRPLALKVLVPRGLPTRLFVQEKGEAVSA